MSLLTGQEFASAGEIRIFSQNPVENAAVLSQTCFIKESQKYPDDFEVKHVLRSAPWFFDGWGIGGNFFSAIYFGDGPLLERVFAVLGILVLGAIALLTLTQGWEAFGEFFANIRFISGYALSLIPTALAAAAGWAILHRATPRSSSTANRDQAPRLARGPSAARPFHPGHTGASVSAWPTPLPPPSCPSPSAAGCSGPPTLS